jgi:hypothetical protein
MVESKSMKNMRSKKTRLPFHQHLIKSMEDGLAALKDDRHLPYTLIPLAPEASSAQSQAISIQEAKDR